jgi:hypothetical protein
MLFFSFLCRHRHYGVDFFSFDRLLADTIALPFFIKTSLI